ncbi:MAG: hypothetical protein ACYS80_19770 [Planctomycetota bacterium]|jgi:hypothetical protein
MNTNAAETDKREERNPLSGLIVGVVLFLTMLLPSAVTGLMFEPWDERMNTALFLAVIAGICTAVAFYVWPPLADFFSLRTRLWIVFFGVLIFASGSSTWLTMNIKTMLQEQDTRDPNDYVVTIFSIPVREATREDLKADFEKGRVKGFGAAVFIQVLIPIAGLSCVVLGLFAPLLRSRWDGKRNRASPSSNDVEPTDLAVKQ